jgi:hypothetical protein
LKKEINKKLNDFVFKEFSVRKLNQREFLNYQKSPKKHAKRENKK